MPVITIFSGNFCNEEPVIQEILTQTDYRLLTDKDIVSRASRMAGIPETKIQRAFSAKTSVFNKFTHERERSIAHLRLALA